MHVSRCGKGTLAARGLCQTKPRVVDSCQSHACHPTLGAVGPQTRQNYAASLLKFENWVNQQEKQVVTDAEVDAAMSAWTEAEFTKGNPASSGERLLCAWMDKFRAFGKHGARKLENTQRSLQGWQRLSPGRSRKPWVQVVWSGMASQIICTTRRAPAREAARSRASASRGLAELLDRPRGRRDGQTNKGPDVQRYTGARRASDAQTRSLLDGPERPRLEKPAVALHLSYLLPILPKGDNRFDAARRPAHGSSGTCWPLLTGHFLALIGSGAKQVGAEVSHSTDVDRGRLDEVQCIADTGARE